MIRHAKVSAVPDGGDSGLVRPTDWNADHVGLTIVRRAVDSAARNSGNTGTTLADDDTLLFPIGANEVWWIEAWMWVNAANVTMDFKWGFSVPAGATMVWADASILLGVSTGSAATAAKTESGSQSRGTLAGTTGLCTAGHVANGATPGTVALQWAQNTSDAGDLKLLANSLLLLWKLA